VSFISARNGVDGLGWFPFLLLGWVRGTRYMWARWVRKLSNVHTEMFLL
jgi:hypothetical protein